jgi:Fic family protein
VCELVGRLPSSPDAERHLHLRRASRIQTIRRSLAIKGNTLTENQIAAVIEGRRVIAPPRESTEPAMWELRLTGKLFMLLHLQTEYPF